MIELQSIANIPFFKHGIKRSECQLLVELECMIILYPHFCLLHSVLMTIVRDYNYLHENVAFMCLVSVNIIVIIMFVDKYVIAKIFNNFFDF